MANLAIKEHSTRGNEVIEILEMLGGVNQYGISTTKEDLLYAIRSHDKFIIGVYPTDTFIVFTLEEFLKKFPYKVGDKVSTLKDINLVFTIKSMTWDTYIDEVVYRIETIEGIENHHHWVASELNPYLEQKRETMEEINIDRIGFNGDKAKLILPDGYEFKTEGKEIYVVKKKPCKEETNMKEDTKLNLSAIDYNNGLVGYEIPGGYEFDTVIDNKVIIKKLKPQYPKTYEECCELLGKTKAYQSVSGYKTELLEYFQQLLICRDAYWKIAGEEMELGKPWEPDWESGLSKYCLVCRTNQIVRNTLASANAILVFPAEEMRDAFYENFKDLIEQCKELL